VNIFQVKCFWAVCEYNSFSEAAEQLYISQSSVSKNIQALEKECGLALFIRNGKYYSISDEGRKLLRYFEQILSTYDQIQETIKEVKERQTDGGQQIYIIGNPAMMRYGIINSVKRFSDFYPDVKVILEEIDEIFLRFALAAGDCDLAFTSDIELDPNKFDWQEYYSESFSIVLQKDSRLAEKKQLCLYDLVGHKLIFSQRNSLLYQCCVNACTTAGFEPNVIFSSSRPMAALEYLRGQNDCAYMTLNRSFREYNDPQYTVIPLIDSPTFKFVLAWKKENKQKTSVKKYLEMMADKTPADFINNCTLYL
jgi:DNA-binding transcriptional LysR family regulator